MIQILKNILTVAVFSTVTIGASAQDLLANHAPADHKLSDLKSIKFNSSPKFIDLNNPASDIYSTWDDKAMSIAPGVLPPNFKIDLRGFAMPTPSRKITSKYGSRWGRQHQGLDVKVYTGDTIYAAFDGKVRMVKYNASGYGYFVVIRHPNGLETLYGHLSKQIVKQNQIVHAGQPIGLGGSTGRSTGSHLHFETRILGQAINPALLFDFERQDVVGDFYVVKSGQIQNNHKSAPASALAVNTQANSEEFVVAKKAQEHQATVNPTLAPAPVKKEPAKHEAPAKQQEATYTVQAGDNLFRIATNNGLTLNQLLTINGLKQNSLIKQGMVLKLQ